MIAIYTFKEFCDLLKKEDDKIIFKEICPAIIRFQKIKNSKYDNKFFSEKITKFEFTGEKFCIDIEQKIINRNLEITQKILYDKYRYLIFEYLIEN